MKYISTRSNKSGAEQSFCDILLAGLAPDGGLYMPQSYPHINAATLKAWKSLSYSELAFAILSLYIDDIPAADLDAICRKTYTAEVYCNGRDATQEKDITPLTWLKKDALALLELSNGPTLAFKDMAMQLLGNLFEHVLARRNEKINILGATSGDTGSAAEYAMRGKAQVNVFMLSPVGRMSAFQRAQMYSLAEPNIFNIAVHGTFDDAQDIVKAVSNDAEFKAHYNIGAVNSINWARVLAQTVYYFKAWLAADLTPGQKLSFVVPSGNFGNICAGHVARMMGLPIDKLIVATNENDVLYEFFSSGSYRPRSSAQTHVTSSPSMDISKASNFERFVFDLLGRDSAQLSQLWRDVESGQGFDLSATEFWPKLANFGFIAGRSTHADRLYTIKRSYDEFGVIIDPHTADALFVAQSLLQNNPGIVLETALPAKFEETVNEALGFTAPRPDAFANIEQRPQHVSTMAADAEAVKAFIVAKLVG